MTAPRTVATVPPVDEFDRKTISLTADFVETALDDPSILAGIPHGAVLVLLPDNDPDFVQESIAIGFEAVRQGKDVVFRHLTRADDRADRRGSR
jgi:Family of unknown function (DUF5647)